MLSYKLRLLVLLAIAAFAQGDVKKKTYIVHMSEHHYEQSGHSNRRDWHASVISLVTNETRLLYSYKEAISGFSARLTEEEVSKLQGGEGFLGAYPDTVLQLQTTYSYKFLGLDFEKGKLWSETMYGEDAIVGILDTGIWPESPSFSDHGLGPVPQKWRGECERGPDSTQSVVCNRKIIGARFYNTGHQSVEAGDRPEYESPRDSRGHGTHTASTAAGSPVHDAGLLGNAHGTALGMAPRARVAIYKVCWDGGCYSSDILAGMDAAIADGVDVISLSIGGFSSPFSQDAVAIGAYRAASKGVFVACAAGNSGPYQYSVSNEAPWLTTVGASTMDRKFLSTVRLHNNRTLFGETLHPGGSHTPHLPLIYAADAGLRNDSRYCLPDTLDAAMVRGKIVVCDRGTTARAQKGQVVRQAGGLAMVLTDTETNGEDTAADAHVIPASQLGYTESKALKKYIAKAGKYSASGELSFSGTVYGLSRAPAVASFSSRGPGLMSAGILKPDLLAPGVNILAAWPLNLAPSGLDTDPRRSEFNVVSGTSMACPHVAGVAALVKSQRPEFSPAAVKSALMTTADIFNTHGGPIIDTSTGTAASAFATGSGQINPEKAVEPGLVYDMSSEDYVPYLCRLGYSDREMQTIVGRRIACRNVTGSSDLNYPSMVAAFNLSDSRRKTSISMKRAVTNVGSARSVYKAHVRAPRGVRVQVKPSRLVFNRVMEKKSFVVRIKNRVKKGMQKEAVFADGSVTWVHSRYRVRSPIAVTWER